MTGRSLRRAAALAFAVGAVAAVPPVASANGDGDGGGVIASHDFVAGIGQLPLFSSGFVNYFAFGAFSNADGSNPAGYLIVTSPEAGVRFTGHVRCLNVHGNQASLVMTFDQHILGQPDKFKGAVFWLTDNGPTQRGKPPVDVQRNFRLTQADLDTTYATCPGLTPPTPGNPIVQGDFIVHDAP